MSNEKIPGELLETKPKAKLGDVFFILGYLMLFCGLWLMAGLGLALTICGSLLIGLGIVSAFFAAPKVIVDA